MLSVISGYSRRGAASKASLASLGAIAQNYETLLFGSSSASGKSYASSSLSARGPGNKWKLLQEHGVDVNPCRSAFHPSCVEGIKPSPGEEVALQDAYTPESECFGCGPASMEGLRLKSYRIHNGLESIVSFNRKFCAFPGIVNGGIVGTAFDCAGNWTAAVALMDLGCLPNPPLTVVAEMLINYEEPTPPEEDLTLKTSVVDIQDSGKVGSKATVHVELSMVQRTAVGDKVIATGHGIFKKLGALRAL